MENCALGASISREAHHDSPPPAFPTGKPLRFLVVCKQMNPAGGIFRFEKAGRELKQRGHEVFFCTMDETPRPWSGKIPVISCLEAFRERWDVTMVAGSGFLEFMPADPFSRFRDARFGLRVQHVLGEIVKRDRFKTLNKQFHPHLVIFNNRGWHPGTFTNFIGNSFHYLIGACDPVMFSPAPAPRDQNGRWIIGGQALDRKNSRALIAALRLLPERFILRLFGSDHDFEKDGTVRDLIAMGRLEFVGVLFDEKLAAYYRMLDCFVSPETQASWGNTSAEAMASGVPIICTAHGTTEFARDGATALLLSSIEPQEIAEKILQLERAPALRARLAIAGREAIVKFDWKTYATELETICRTSGRKRHYFYAPELGLHGKWPMETRLKGLEPILALAEGRTLLDFSAAEGWIAHSMCQAGARLVHGLELDADRVCAARELCREFPCAEFHVVDLSDPRSASWESQKWLHPSYDIVLYLGVHHHLPAGSRIKTFRAAATFASSCFAIRTNAELFEKDNLEGLLLQEGFHLKQSDPGDTQQNLGPLWLFERNAASPSSNQN
jgi:glycosyltransferase involved in cell wall biosynthesis